MRAHLSCLTSHTPRHRPTILAVAHHAHREYLILGVFQCDATALSLALHAHQSHPKTLGKALHRYCYSLENREDKTQACRLHATLNES